MGNSRLEKQYKEQVVANLMKAFNYTNTMQVPRLQKIIISMGFGEATRDAKIMDDLAGTLGQITGQKAVITRAKKSIANFKLRAGMPVGARVTLRHDRMYEFLDRLMNIAIPRIRDFRGLSTRSFDGHGNYSLGLTEQLVFPEINYDDISRVQGMNITIVTNARSDEECRELLRLLGMPFAN